MANAMLFRSACLLGMIHIYLMLFFRVPYLFGLVMISGVFSSIVNHGLTGEWAKWLDRWMMVVGAVIDGAYLYVVFWESSLINIFNSLILMAAASYLLAKVMLQNAPPEQAEAVVWQGSGHKPQWTLRRADLPHLFAHLFLSLLHYVLIVNIDHYCRESRDPNFDLFDWQLHHPSFQSNLLCYSVS